MTRLRIALDALPLQVRSAGIAMYVRHLARALAERDDAPDVRLFGIPWPAAPPHDVGGRDWPAGISVVASARYPLVMGAPFAFLPRAVDCEAALGPLDVFHATAYAVPRSRRAPVVLTVHDVILLRRPELGTPALRRSVQRAAARAREARLVIADSQATRNELIALAGVSPAMIRVVPLGVDATFAPQPPAAARRVATRLGVDTPYLLHVGTIEPRKNLPLLIDACTRLRRGGRLTQHRLVLAGPPGWGAAAVDDAIARHGAEAFVVRLGRVADADLPALYAGADAVLLPSLGEGFGLPLIEAMACGVPVLAADAGALPEVAADAAVLIDPTDADAWAEGIARLLADPDLVARLRAAGPRRAAQFTWRRCADETLRVYAEALR